LARAKSDEGGYLATLADIDSTTPEQGNGSILASKPGPIPANAEALGVEVQSPNRTIPAYGRKTSSNSVPSGLPVFQAPSREAPLIHYYRPEETNPHSRDRLPMFRSSDPGSATTSDTPRASNNK
jgi:hypothetical protein